jgi:hypothetical protein
VPKRGRGKVMGSRDLNQDLDNGNSFIYSTMFMRHLPFARKFA